MEEQKQPSLKGKPFAVGGLGMISTASYEARRYGVRSAMPGFIALKLCPQLVFAKSDFAAYRAASKLCREVFAEFDPKFRAFSLDEARLDITTYISKNGCTADECARQIQKRVTEHTSGLTCSVGCARGVSWVAKIASDVNKPRGVFCPPQDRDALVQYVRSLPIRKVPGVGKVGEATLREAFGINTVGDLYDRRCALAAAFGIDSKTFSFYSRIAAVAATTWAVEDSKDSGKGGRKSISAERTFRETNDLPTLQQVISRIAERLANDLAEHVPPLPPPKTLTLKLKQSDFTIASRQKTDAAGLVVNAETLVKWCSNILEKEMSAQSALSSDGRPPKYRLLGIKLSNWREDAAPPISTYFESVHSNARTNSVASDSEACFVQTSVSLPAATDTSREGTLAQASPTVLRIHCPVCHRELDTSDNRIVNQHIDACLSKPLVKELARRRSNERTCHNQNSDGTPSSKEGQTRGAIDRFVLRQQGKRSRLDTDP